MVEIEFTKRWHSSFPESHVGLLLLSGVNNQNQGDALEPHKRELERTLREQYANHTRAELQDLEVMRAYRAYYKQFDQTYHVQLQLESVAHKNKSLPSVNPLVDAYFIAELQTLVLTAGHDADLLESPVRIDATQGDESFTQMNGAVRTLKANDMMMLDAQGIVCSILHGQDRRTAINPGTIRALYVAYAPVGVPEASVLRQLGLIRDLVRVFSPEATVERLEVHRATPGAGSA